MNCEKGRGRHVECGIILPFDEIDDFDRQLVKTLHEMVFEREEKLSHRHEINPFYQRKPGDTAVRLVDLRDRLGTTSSRLSRHILKLTNLEHEPIWDEKRDGFVYVGVL